MADGNNVLCDIPIVITIIILLILAGITISALKGSELFAKAQQAKQETNEAAAIEEMSIIVSQVQVDKLGDATLSDVVEVLESDTENTYIVRTTKTIVTLDSSGITDITQITSETPAIYVTNTKYNVEVEINSSLKIASNGTEGSSNSGTGNTGESGNTETGDVQQTGIIKIKLACKAEGTSLENPQLKITVIDEASYNKIEYYIDNNRVYTSEDGSEKTYTTTSGINLGQEYNVTVYGYKIIPDTGDTIRVNSYPSLYSQVNVGDWVNYDAGNWTSSETSGFTTSYPEKQGEFSKLDATSKNQSMTGNTYSGGWRVLSKDASTQKVVLVHAGTTAIYYGDPYYSSSSLSNINNFCSTYYGANASRQMVSSARSVNYHDCYGNLNNTTGLSKTGRDYWLATLSSKRMYGVSSEGSVREDVYGRLDVRPVVYLKSGVQTTGKTTNAYNTSVQGWDLTYSE